MRKEKDQGKQHEMNPLPGENWVLRVVVETKEHEVIISRLTDTVADDRPRKELQFLLNT